LRLSAFLLFSQGIQVVCLKREVLWLRERRSGGRGLQAKFVS
jgi:hypothetical protein